MFQMQQEHRLALTKNYVLLVNETPVDVIMDEIRQQQIVDEEQREFIARQPTQKGRTRALLDLLPRKGPKSFHAFCYALYGFRPRLNKSDLPDENWNVLGSTFPCLLFLGRLAQIPTRYCYGPTEHSRRRETTSVLFWAINLTGP
jgi:hypothetical protein